MSDQQNRSHTRSGSGAPAATPEASEAGANSPHLNRDEQDQAAEHSTPRALVIHEIVREEGEAAMDRTAGALIWSALAAGLSMGFSFLVQSILESALPETSWRGLVSSFGYTVGFVIVILGRQQLFTESTLSAVLPVLTRRDMKTFLKTLRLWSIVLLFNLIGTVIFASILQFPGVFSPEVTESLAKVAQTPLTGSFGVTVVRGMFAGWLIALMVWLLPSARAARLLTILLITYTVAVSKLSHVIAGSVEASYAVMTGAASIGDYFGVFLLPTFIGNMIGGISLVAIVNHAAIAPEITGAPNRQD
jgi:formate/nitrite transporter FocA (FNT family)